VKRSPFAPYRGQEFDTQIGKEHKAAREGKQLPVDAQAGNCAAERQRPASAIEVGPIKHAGGYTEKKA
jgi:hypothetical protein